jgi:hypothetical protein
MKAKQVRSDLYEVSISESSFRFLQLTDTHFDESDFFTILGNAFLINQLLSRHTPHLVIHSGDLESDPTDMSKPLAGLSYFLGCSTPWALALGNHDPDGNQILSNLDKALEGLPSAQRKQSIANFLFGFCTTAERKEFCYRINVIHGTELKPSLCFFIFDSGSGSGHYSEPKKVPYSQLQWFHDQIQFDSTQSISAPVIAVIHRPLKEFASLSNQHNGTLNESVCYDDDTGETLSALLSSGRSITVISGHDHSNSGYGSVSGANLIYGRKTGVGGYKPSDMKLGGRLFQYDFASEVLSHHEVFSTIGDILSDEPVAFGCWSSIRTGHQLIAFSNYGVLDWIPSNGSWRLWKYDPSSLNDIFPGSPIAHGTFSLLPSITQMLYLGGNYLLGWSETDGAWELLQLSSQQSNCSIVSISRGYCSTIHKGAFLISLGEGLILDWCPSSSEWRLLKSSPFSTDWIFPEVAVVNGLWNHIDYEHRLVPISKKHILDWSPSDGNWRLWNYDIKTNNILLGEPDFLGTWLTIGKGHELISMADGKLLDWMPSNGSWRLWKDCFS